MRTIRPLGRAARPGTQLLARLWVCLLGIWLLAGPPPARAAVIPYGEGFPADPSSAPQALPRVAVSATGAAVIVWQTADGGGPGLDVAAQLRLPGGATRQFTANEGRAGYQLSPAVAMAASGGFAVAWEHARSSDEADVFIRFFDPDGAPLGPEQEVSGAPTSNDRAPDLAMSPDGHAIVVWQSEVRSGKGLGATHWRLHAQSFAPGGARERGWLVGELLEGDQTGPRVAMAGRDRYAIAWEQLPPQVKAAPPEANAARVYLARTSPGGTSEERVEPSAAGEQREPALAMDAAGNLAVAWSAPGPGAGAIFARAYPAAGPAGGALEVSPPGDEAVGRPAVAVGKGGGLLVAWQHSGSGGAPPAVSARSYGADGRADGPPFALPQDDGRRSFFPHLALRPDGSGLAVWHSLPAAGLSPLAYGRRLGPPFEREPTTPIPREPSPLPPGQPHRALLPLVATGAGSP